MGTLKMWTSLYNWLKKTLNTRSYWRKKLVREGFTARCLGLRFNQNPYIQAVSTPKGCPLSLLERANAWDNGWFLADELARGEQVE